MHFPRSSFPCLSAPPKPAKVQGPKVTEHHLQILITLGTGNQLTAVLNSCPYKCFTKFFKFTSLPSWRKRRNLTITRKESQKGRRGSRGASESTHEIISPWRDSHRVNWNLTETTRGQCSKHKGKGNGKNRNRSEEDVGGRCSVTAYSLGRKKGQPLVSPLRSLPLLGKEKGSWLDLA